jgi:peptidoglycan/xylan/chitin deacetylase (PgdA/CDA1 family)
MNEAAFEQLDQWGIAYSSDGRAEPNLIPYRLALATGKAKHVQYPTTLPTFDELIGIDGADEFAAVKKLLAITQSNPNDQVFTLHAELEGQKLLPAFEQLLAGWLNQGHDLVTMGELHKSWDATKQLDKIALLPLTWGEIPNRSGELIIQSNYN